MQNITGNTTFKLSSIALALMSLSIQAQETVDESKLEKIEVTARKTVESIQEVPVSITSIGAAELSEKGISVLTEVQQFSPNTTLQTSRGTNSTLTAFIRGVGQQDPLWGYEPGVGIYVNDVYVARPQGAVLDLLDVSRIEVLRGPQGALYGKNTIGGAVKYVTNPMTGDATFNGEVTIGDYARRDMKLTGQLPLSDNLYVGFGVANLARDGFGEFVTSALDGQDRENYNKDLMAARLDVEFQPAEDTFIRLSWDKTEDDSNAKGGFRLLPSILTEAPVPDSVFDSYTSMPTWNKVEIEGYSLVISHQLTADMELKYIGSSRESYSPTNIDFDNTSLDIFDVPAEYKDENTTHEVQMNYLGDGYTVVSGVYMYDGESCGNFDAILGFLGRAAYGVPGLTREVTGCNNSESTAVYAHADFALTDQLSMGIGARYTNEEKQAVVNNGLIFDNVYPYDNWIPGYTRPAATYANGQIVPQVLGTDTDGDGVLDAPKSADWSRFTPKVSVEYTPRNDLMFYASYSQGFKSGTFNPRATINEPAVDPEIVDSFEVGMKADWNDNLRTNITFFTLDHKDRQYISVLPGENATDLQQILGNVGQSSANGIEAEITYVASDALTFDFSLGTIDASFDEVITTLEDGSQADISDGFKISNTPDLTYNLAANYVINSDMGEFVLNANYYYRGDYNIFEANSLITQDGYGLLNASINWISLSGDWYGGLHLKNITDEEYIVGGYEFVTQDADGNYVAGLGGDNTLIGYYGDPATVALTVGYRF